MEKSTLLIGIISDTHGELPDHSWWPQLDLFIHAGDVAPNPSNTCGDIEIQKAWRSHFQSWIVGVKATCKVIVPGNHDLLFEQQRSLGFCADARYLHDTSITGIQLFGTGWTYHNTTRFGFPWAYGDQEEGLEEKFVRIPESTQILVTHSPVLHELDNPIGMEVGSLSLRRRIAQLENIRLHIHGHAHSAGGQHQHQSNHLVINAANHFIWFDWDKRLQQVRGRLNKRRIVQDT